MPGQFTAPPSGQKDSDANCDFWVILGDTEHPHFLSAVSEHTGLRGTPLHREQRARGYGILPCTTEQGSGAE